MKIGLICPHLPPRICGVGDYTARLATELANQGHSVCIATAEPAPDNIGGCEVKSFAMPWASSAFSEMARWFSGKKLDRIILQYTPQLYAPATLGVHPALAVFIGRLKRVLGVPIIVTVHEAHYPVGIDARGVLLGVPQFFQFNAIAASADKAFFTYTPTKEKTARRLFWRKHRFAYSPVGSNIPVANSISAESRTIFEAVRSAIPEKQKILFHFGGAHPTRQFDFTFKAFQEALSSLGNESVVLVFAGLTRQSCEQVARATGYDNLLPFIRALGVIPSEVASLWLKASTLVLSPFSDGISTRRGSAMAAFAHGCAVIGTRGTSTDASIDWDSFCALAPSNNANAFVDETVGLLTDPARAQALGKRAEQYYENAFSWPVIAGKMTEPF